MANQLFISWGRRSHRWGSLSLCGWRFEALQAGCLRRVGLKQRLRTCVAFKQSEATCGSILNHQPADFSQCSIQGYPFWGCPILTHSHMSCIRGKRSKTIAHVQWGFDHMAPASKAGCFWIELWPWVPKQNATFRQGAGCKGTRTK